MSNFNTFLIPAVAILSIIFFIRLIFRALFLIWLFQLKEYRFDRLFVHFRETKEGRRFFWSRRELAIWLLFLMPFFYRFPYVLDAYIIFVVLIFAYEAKEFIAELRKKQLRKPTFTAKAIVLTIGTMLIVLSLSMPFSSITLIFVDRFLIVIVAFFVFALGTLTTLVKTALIILAKRKLSQVKNLLVIGVTGSYGKSSTKELLAEFLSAKYNVLKTPGSVNTDLGIAKFILKELNKNHEVFVVEIGAYKRGEIAAVCDIVRPTIGVLTGINEQHLALFGSIENTKKAKMELIESLPNDGIALFNGDAQMVLETIKTFQVLRTHSSRLNFIYTTDSDVLSIKHLGGVMKLTPQGKVVVVTGKVRKNTLELKADRKTYTFALPTSIEKPFVTNLVGALFLALKLGVQSLPLQEKLTKGVASLGLKVATKRDITILDDTFNSNPAGFRAALDVLSSHKKRRIIITPGIIELGNESYRIHRELGEKLGTICDVVILTNDNFEEPIREGLTKTKFNMKNFLIPKREELVGLVKNKISNKTTILFEGRVPNELLTFNF